MHCFIQNTSVSSESFGKDQHIPALFPALPLCLVALRVPRLQPLLGTIKCTHSPRVRNRLCTPGLFLRQLIRATNSVAQPAQCRAWFPPLFMIWYLELSHHKIPTEWNSAILSGHPNTLASGAWRTAHPDLPMNRCVQKHLSSAFSSQEVSPGPHLFHPLSTYGLSSTLPTSLAILSK